MPKIRKLLEETFNREIISESVKNSLARVLRHFQKSEVAIMTAFRARDEEGNILDLPSNRKRNNQLIADIKSAGYAYFPVKGVYPEVNPQTKEKEMVHEESIFIIDAKNQNAVGGLKEFVIGQGRKWNQDSVIFKPAGEDAMLIGTNDDAGWIKNGEVVVIGQEKFNQPADIFIKMKGGRQFQFTEEVDITAFESYFTQCAKAEAMRNRYGGLTSGFKPL